MIILYFQPNIAFFYELFWLLWTKSSINRCLWSFIREEKNFYDPSLIKSKLDLFLQRNKWINTSHKKTILRCDFLMKKEKRSLINYFKEFNSMNIGEKRTSCPSREEIGMRHLISFDILRELSIRFRLWNDDTIIVK